MAEQGGHMSKAVALSWKKRASAMKKQGPLTGKYRVTDLAQAISLSPRAIRSYVERKLIPPPSGRGTGLIYGDRHMHRLVAMRKLQKETGRLLEDIAADLDKLSPAQLAVLAAPAMPGAAPVPGAASSAMAPKLSHPS